MPRKQEFRAYIGVRIRRWNFRWTSRDRCRAQKPPRQREPQTVVVTSNRGVIRPQVSSRVQISIRWCSFFFSYGMPPCRTRRDETRRGKVCPLRVSPCSLPFIPIPWSVSASVLCNFPSRRFDEYLRRDLEALINPWQERGEARRPSLPSLSTNCRGQGPRVARLITKRNNDPPIWSSLQYERDGILVVSMDEMNTDCFRVRGEKATMIFSFFDLRINWKDSKCASFVPFYIFYSGYGIGYLKMILDSFLIIHYVIDGLEHVSFRMVKGKRNKIVLYTIWCIG